jgi:hypothetical protein
MGVMKIRPLIVALSLAIAISCIGVARADEDSDPIVVELFTSQGCSSCPPADKFLGELAMQPGILALSFHVDYWDYIGWKDPYASHQATQRQRKYAHIFDIGYVYTPQMVVQGTTQAVGSDRSDVEAAIQHLRQKRPAHPSVSLERHGDGSLAVHVGAGETQAPATVWLVCFDRHHETDVPSGENAGERLTDYHVVRYFDTIGQWRGAALDLNVPAKTLADYTGDANGAIAVLVQTDGTGPILTAAVLHDQR